MWSVAMNLGEIAIGSSVTVSHVGGERPFRRRMMELGLLPGTRVEVMRVAPLGDPIELRVRGCLLSIRRDEARAVEVRTEHGAPPALRDAPPVAPLAPGLPAAS
jgi:ferrous iron transport protein A